MTTLSQPQQTTPDVGAIVGGKYIDMTASRCDASQVESLGYDWILHADVTVGTAFPFYSEVYIPASNTSAVSASVVGNPSRDHAYYFEPTEPSPGSVTPPSGTLHANITALGDGFEYTDYGGEEWTGTVHGLVPGVASRYTDETGGRCFLLVGELVPTVLTEGTISDPYSTPAAGIIVAGEYHEFTASNCDHDAVEAAGYEWILRTEVTTGTPSPFYVEVYVPSTRPGPVQALVIGDPSKAAVYYTPTILGGVPAS